MVDPRFTYEVVTSPLQSEEEKLAILEPLARVLDRAGGGRDRAADDRPVLYLVLTGGTEQQALDRIAGRGAHRAGQPVLLVAHPGHNSLPACLEILARVRRDGGEGEIVLLDRSW